MKRTITETSLSLTLRLVTDTEQESERAYSPFGPVRAGLITLRITERVQPLVLHNSWERQAETQPYKLCTDLNTLNTDTESVAVVKPLLFIIEGAGTNEG